MSKNIAIIVLSLIAACQAAVVIPPVVADVFTGFEITDRGTLPYAVPVVRGAAAYGGNEPTALDVVPRGNPSDTTYGKAWLHVCNDDVLGSPSAGIGCAFAGAYSDHAAIGTSNFNGEPVRPLYLMIGTAKVGELNASGLVIDGSITANNYVTAGGGPPPPPACVPEGSDLVLIHMDGMNGSTAFADKGQQCLSITSGGNVHVDTSWAAAGTGSALFGSGGGYLLTSPAQELSFGSSPWTIQFTVKSTQTGRADVVTQNSNYTAANFYGLLFNVSSSGQMQWYEGSNARISATATGWNNGSPHVVKIARVGNVVSMYLDGAQVGSSYTTGYGYGNASTGLRIGNASYSGAGSFIGNIDEFSIQ